MNPDTANDISEALERAKENDIPVVEIWLGPQAYGHVQSAVGNVDDIKLSPAPGDSTNTNVIIYHGLRVRRMADEGVRAGTTTCQFGPGVT